LSILPGSLDTELEGFSDELFAYPYRELEGFVDEDFHSPKTGRCLDRELVGQSFSMMAVF